MCGGMHYGEVEELVSVERWPCVVSYISYVNVHMTLQGLWVVCCPPSLQEKCAAVCS